ncbi:PorP/SprF family type IX secretion system membrane protein [Polluticoccus soli]|uniref:PorP/SprF family type IX secretion system membrane protein n=1 Tax=Polluticoccus soli TaxID=3034150 RepID=UPI0023E1B59E|nr:PorP/SprF family type IX secretion system membrane protein [Flavipsychrobacter sp. JY13-12]
MKKYIVVAVLSLSGVKALAQDIHFSQFYETSILRNPALTGIFSGDYKAGVNYRQQWSNISVPFTTVMATAESRILVNRDVGDYLSYGVAASYDKAGSINFKSTQIYPAINFNKAIEDDHNSYLSVGFTAGYIQRSVDLTRATYASQYSGTAYIPGSSSGENVSSTVIRNYDLGSGLSFNSTTGPNNSLIYYVGVAGYHITKPKHTFNGSDKLVRLNTKWTANMGFSWAINDEYGLTGHLNYVRQLPYQETMFGALVNWKSVFRYTGKPFVAYAGLFVRTGDAIIPTLKVDYDRYYFVASYDINTSGLRPASEGAGGMELSVFVRGVWPKTRYYETRCPAFEQMLPSTFSDY